MLECNHFHFTFSYSLHYTYLSVDNLLTLKNSLHKKTTIASKNKQNLICLFFDEITEMDRYLNYRNLLNYFGDTYVHVFVDFILLNL